MRLEALLRRDRAWTAAGLLAVVALSWLYLLRGPAGSHPPMAMNEKATGSLGRDARMGPMEAEEDELPG